jgi:hypothetical protein
MLKMDGGPRYVLTGPGVGRSSDRSCPRGLGGKALADVARAAAAGVFPPIDSTVPFQLEPMRQALRRAAAHLNNALIVIQMGSAHGI